MRDSDGIGDIDDVIIYGDGRVSRTQHYKPLTPDIYPSRSTLNGIVKLAEAEKFFSMPPLMGEPTPNQPDIPYDAQIDMATTSGKYTVTLEYANGRRNASFCQLYNVLLAVGGLSPLLNPNSPYC